MHPAIPIAQILGPIYLIVAAGMALNAPLYQRMVQEFLASAALAYLGGLMALVFGLVILVFHHDWPGDWRVVVTLIGWLSLAKGGALIIAPAALGRLYAPLIANPARLRLWAVIPLILGLFFCVNGYF